MTSHKTVIEIERIEEAAVVGESPKKKGNSEQAIMITVVVPTLNERDNVPRVVDVLSRVLEGIAWEVIFVDDDSPDGTADVVRSLGREQLRVRCVHRVGRRGLSTACIEGMLASNAPYLALMDGDLQHDPTLLRQMINILEAEDVDVVVGSRYVEGGSCGSWSPRRRQISQLGTHLGRLVLKEDVKDPMSTFFVLRRELFSEVVHKLSGLSFKILLDILASAHRSVKFREIPFVLGQRQTGESKFDANVACEYFLLLADKSIGRYIPMQFISPALIGTICALAHLTIVAILFGLSDLGFLASESISSAISLGVIYVTNSVSRRRDREIALGLWVMLLLSFIVVGGVGIAANIELATYLMARGVNWFLAAAAGVTVWMAWNCAATNYSVGVKIG